ncbi:uncharacterized protein BKA55DRAFT_141265 [Fusarium redolens]|uniref:Uncharacterized protein n=1 Tax=Fusarium redolens TaxID=48865 RepID=A0A9P9GC51_FUSRE|nr:uncharacterized protein BKA55DRAFT_141265 [Fusarium redolens]KAH7235042.1 hypothetical protein BKA55DRAFT_141265 [Fusarium redolens]
MLRVRYQSSHHRPSSSLPKTSPRKQRKGKKKTRLSDVHQHPPQPRAQGQDHSWGRDHQANHLYTAAARDNHRHPCGQGERTKRVFTLGCRGYTFINQGGICGSFREPREGRIL